jgi:hypothetical protein
MITREDHEPNELDKAFPNGIQTMRDAVFFLTRWRDIKITVLPDYYWVEVGNLRSRMEEADIQKWATELYEEDQRRSADAREWLRKDAIERRQREQAQNRFFLVFMIMFSLGTVVYIILMGAHL